MINEQSMSYGAVIFDLFGTLVDDFVASTGQMNSDLASALNAPYEPFTRVWRQTSEMRTNGTFQTVEASIEYVCGTLGVQVTAEQMMQAVQIRLQQIKRALQPRPDAVPTLMRLKDRGCKIGLLSNCSIEIPILWPETPFADLIDSAVFSSRERLKKPDPRTYHLACERLGVIPERCLYIADGENYELAAAASVGLHPVLIRNPTSQNRLELFRESIEWRGATIQSLAEILQLTSAVP
ncbi:MAG: HAD-IA family hydrolase [Deltaproteobacteria bacterium]|nr:HAD-IA family hydrolase [Deltaproteobacteria bacterium]